MSHCLRCDQERERERERGTGILFEEPNPTGSRPSDLIGLYRVGKGDPNRRKGAAGKGVTYMCASAMSGHGCIKNGQKRGPKGYT